MSNVLRMPMSRLVVLVIVIVAIMPGVSVAQTATGTLGGTVVDTSGGALPGATIELRSEATGLSRTQVTSQTGAFVFSLVPPGLYKLTASLSGFAPATVSDLELTVGDQRTLRVEMRVAGVETAVEVTAALPFQSSGATGTVISRETIASIPLNGRSFQSLLHLTPGVVPMASTAFRPGQFSVNGQRDSANYFTVDGVSANTGVLASGANLLGVTGDSAGVNVLGSTVGLVALEALEEFRIQTSSFAPEFGRSPGGQVSLITRSGTNSFHGSAFEFVRDERFDAADWFANSRGLPKSELTQHQFGGSFGGPIVRDRTFFFGSLEALRLTLPTTVVEDVPSLAARAAATGVAQAIVESFPTPTGRDYGNGLAEYAGTWSDPSRSTAVSIRVDHRLSPGAQIFGRYSYAPSSSDQRSFATRGAGQVFRTTLDSQTVTGGATWFPGSRFGLDARVNYAENVGTGGGIDDAFDGSEPVDPALLFPSGVTPDTGLVAVFLTSANTTVYSRGTNGPNTQRQINAVVTASRAIGTHEIKAGIDYRRLMPTFGNRGYQQSVFFPNVDAVVAGQTTRVSLSTFRRLYPRFQNFSAFAQDTWRLTPRATLTYGVRWELNPAPGERDGNLPATVIGLDDPATMTLAPSGTEPYETSFGDIAPRVGLSYRVVDDPVQETVLRGGFGVFYHMQSSSFGNAYDSFSYPNLGSRELTAVRFPLTAEQAAPPPFSPSAPYAYLNAFPPDLASPYTLQWNVTADRAVGTSQSVSLSYVGANGRRMYRREFLGVPNPSFVNFSLVRNLDSSEYHALQTQWQRRLRGSFQALVSYTLSKSTDTSSADTDRMLPNAISPPERDRGPSDFDRRHALTGTLSYRTPAKAGLAGALLGNWSVDTIFRALSAAPVNVTLSVAARTVRPDLTPGIPLYIDDAAAPGGQRFNDAVDPSRPGCKGPFCPPAANTQGTMPRNLLRGFPARQIDLALRRRLPFGSMSVDLQVDVFNVLNIANFGDPSGVLTASTFGRSSSMLNRSLGGLNALYQIGGPRSMQFGLKVQL
jgi:hypothetical protein